MTDDSGKAQSVEDELLGEDASTELSSNRTAMSFARTEMSGERTLMSIVRTSLSLIGFGFTIFQFMRSIAPQLSNGAMPSGAPASFGLSLVALGVLLLVLGLIGHWQRVRDLRARRTRLYELHLVRNLPHFRISAITAVAFFLLVIGLLAILRMAFGVGPF